MPTFSVSPASQTVAAGVYTGNYTCIWFASSGGPTAQDFDLSDAGGGGFFLPGGAAPVSDVADWNSPPFSFTYKNATPGTYTITIHAGSGPLSGAADRTVTCIVTGGTVLNGVVAFEGAATFLAAATRNIAGRLDFAGTGEMIARPTTTPPVPVYGAVDFAGSGELIGRPTPEARGSLALSGSSWLDAVFSSPAQANFAGGGELITEGVRARIAASVDYRVEGPVYLVVGSPSTFTIERVPGGLGTAATVSIHADIGGVLTPASLALPALGTRAVFTYTPPTAGAVNLSFTNSGGLTDPPPLGLVVSDAYKCIQPTSPALPFAWNSVSGDPGIISFDIPLSDTERFFGGHISVTYTLSAAYTGPGRAPRLGIAVKPADNATYMGSYEGDLNFSYPEVVFGAIPFGATTLTSQVPLTDFWFDCCEDASGASLKCRMDWLQFFPARTITISDLTLCLRQGPFNPITGVGGSILVAPSRAGLRGCAAANPSTVVEGTITPDRYLNGTRLVRVAGVTYTPDNYVNFADPTVHINAGLVRYLNFPIPHPPTAPDLDFYLEYAVISLSGKFVPDHTAGEWETSNDRPRFSIHVGDLVASGTFDGQYGFVFDPGADPTTQPIRLYLSADWQCWGGDPAVHRPFPRLPNTINNAILNGGVWSTAMAAEVFDDGASISASRTWGRFHLSTVSLELHYCVFDGYFLEATRLWLNFNHPTIFDGPAPKSPQIMAFARWDFTWSAAAGDLAGQQAVAFARSDYSYFGPENFSSGGGAYYWSSVFPYAGNMVDGTLSVTGLFFCECAGGAGNQSVLLAQRVGGHVVVVNG